MSEKPQQSVSREAAQDDSPLTPEQVMLNEIMDRSMSKFSESSEGTSAQQSAVEPDDVSRETRRGEIRSDSERPDGHSSSRSFAPPSPTEPEDGSAGTPSENPSFPPEKNKSSSVYIYLAVLFGAAFLMLLLAYFVQQRNSDAVRDDLRATTASREELLENIQQLEKEKAKLQQDSDLHENAVTQVRELYEQQRQEAQEYSKWLDEAQLQLTNSIVLGYLERFINEKDYLMAACVVQDCDHFFNERNWMHSKNSQVLPTQAARYLELRDWLEDHGHVLVVQYNDNKDGSGPSEQPVVALGYGANADHEAWNLAIAARNLWPIFRYYAENPASDYMDAAATLLAGFYNPDELGGSLEYLNTKNFRPSTIELFEQIKADLIDRGMLVEVDGVVKYAQDGVPVDIPRIELESIGRDSVSSYVDPANIADVLTDPKAVIFY